MSYSPPSIYSQQKEQREQQIKRSVAINTSLRILQVGALWIIAVSLWKGL